VPEERGRLRTEVYRPGRKDQVEPAKERTLRAREKLTCDDRGHRDRRAFLGAPGRRSATKARCVPSVSTPRLRSMPPEGGVAPVQPRNGAGDERAGGVRLDSVHGEMRSTVDVSVRGPPPVGEFADEGPSPNCPAELELPSSRTGSTKGRYFLEAAEVPWRRSGRENTSTRPRAGPC